MRTKILSLFIALCATIVICAQNNVIYYTASSKLPETTIEDSAGLHINAFDASITTHTFADGKGTVTLDKDLTDIGNKAFYGCIELISIVLPASLANIGYRVFEGCNSVKEITCYATTPPTYGGKSEGKDRIIGEIYGLGKLRIPIDSYELYKNALWWQYYFKFDQVYPIYGNKCGVNISWTFFDGTLTVTGNGEMYDFHSTETPWVDYTDSIRDIIINGSITKIGNYAFKLTSSLESINIPSSVLQIGDYAFAYCNSIKSITIPNSVDTIGEFAFLNIDNVYYNGSATGAPWGAKAINSFVDGDLFYSDATKTELIGCSFGASGVITIPNSVWKICDNSFKDCQNITSVSIPNSVTYIGNSAFESCYSLTSISIPTNLTYLGNSAFMYCKELSSPIVIPNMIEKIGDSTFWACVKLDSIKLPSNLKSIGNSAFVSCKRIRNLTIPNSVESIGPYAFQYSGLKSFVIPNKVSEIKYGTFEDCYSLESVTIPNNVNSIDAGAFSMCWNITSLNIPNSVTQIGNSAFEYVNNINYSGNATWDFWSINWGAKCLNGFLDGKLAYRDSTKTKLCGCSASFEGAIEIPRSVDSISDIAFTGLENTITSIKSFAAIPPVGGFYSYSGDFSIPVYIPKNSLEAYKTADGWSEFTNFQPQAYGPCGDNLYWYYWDDILNIEGIGGMWNFRQDSVPWLQYRDSVIHIEIANGTTSIGENAFYGLSNKEFKTLVLPNSMLTIKDSAFADCAWLKTITMGTDLEEIGDYAFSNDSRLIYINCYATEPPLLGATPFANYNAYLKVPCNVKDEYVVSLGWSSFTNISCISAETVEVTEIQSDPTSTSVEIAWPAVSGSDNYTIEVKQGSKVICTIIFNAQGQLLSINFPTSAPARGIANAQEAVETATGWAYTINGLTPGTAYTYSVVAKDANGKTIDTKNGSFSTTSPTAIENINDIDSQKSKVKSQKFLRDGVLLIERNGIYYNAQGTIVK